MGLLDNLLGTDAGLPPGQGNAPVNGLVAAAVQALSQGGGVQGLSQGFESQGLGRLLSSWIGTGQNLPISAEQIQALLGSDAIQALASRFGLSTATATDQLAKHLPGMIDQATPQGQMPAGGIGDLLKSFLG